MGIERLSTNFGELIEIQWYAFPLLCDLQITWIHHRSQQLCMDKVTLRWVE